MVSGKHLLTSTTFNSHQHMKHEYTEWWHRECNPTMSDASKLLIPPSYSRCPHFVAFAVCSRLTRHFLPMILSSFFPYLVYRFLILFSNQVLPKNSHFEKHIHSAHLFCIFSIYVFLIFLPSLLGFIALDIWGQVWDFDLQLCSIISIFWMLLLWVTWKTLCCKCSLLPFGK